MRLIRLLFTEARASHISWLASTGGGREYSVAYLHIGGKKRQNVRTACLFKPLSLRSINYACTSMLAKNIHITIHTTAIIIVTAFRHHNKLLLLVGDVNGQPYNDASVCGTSITKLHAH